MRNKHRQSHNFLSLKSSIEIVHKTSFSLCSHGDSQHWNRVHVPDFSFICRPNWEINFIYENVQIHHENCAFYDTVSNFAIADSSTAPEVQLAKLEPQEESGCPVHVCI